jgi:hypothetical protein
MQIDFLEQVRYAANSNIIVSSASSGAMMHILHMPIGSDHCCAAVELLPGNLASHSHLEMAKGMSIDYIGLRELSETQSTISGGSITKIIAEKVLPLLLSRSQLGTSCEILSEIL